MRVRDASEASSAKEVQFQAAGPGTEEFRWAFKVSRDSETSATSTLHWVGQAKTRDFCNLAASVLSQRINVPAATESNQTVRVVAAYWRILVKRNFVVRIRVFPIKRGGWLACFGAAQCWLSGLVVVATADAAGQERFQSAGGFKLSQRLRPLCLPPLLELRCQVPRWTASRWHLRTATSRAGRSRMPCPRCGLHALISELVKNRAHSTRSFS